MDDVVMRGFGSATPVAAALVTQPGRGLWCGIDPGKTGYVAVLLPNGMLRTWPIPVDEEGNYNEAAIRDIVMELVALGVRDVMLERQQPAYPRPGQNLAANVLVKASFMIGYGYALWVMALRMVGVTPRVVMPGVWKRAMGIAVTKDEGVPLKGRRKAGKAKAVALATSQHPLHDFRRTPKSQPSPDQCEAVLLAEYGRVTYG